MMTITDLSRTSEPFGNQVPNFHQFNRAKRASVPMHRHKQSPARASQAPWEWHVLLSMADNQRRSSWLSPVSSLQLWALLGREAFCTCCIGTGCIQVPFCYITPILSFSKLSSLKEVLSSSSTKHYFKEVCTTDSLFFSWDVALFNSWAHFK